MNENEFSYKDFVSRDKSLLIAPAGYGKTHTIAECLKYTEGHQLILTHTHAGIASIKEKASKKESGCKYSVETISSFAQRYVEAFFCGSFPDQESNDFFPFIIKKAIDLFKKESIKDVFKANYSGLFVDEYQDCTILHHSLIMELAEMIPTHILGDPLQGIFDFNGEELVNFKEHLGDYAVYELNEPWRWKDKNHPLGNLLKEFREKLESGQKIDLFELNSISNCSYHTVQSKEILSLESNYRKRLNYLTYNPDKIKDFKNVLLICPEKTIWERVSLNQNLSYRFFIIEAFDEKDFYKKAKEIDNLSISNQILIDLFSLLKGKKIERKQRNGKIRADRVGTLLTGLSSYFPNDDKIPMSNKDGKKEICEMIIDLKIDFSFLKFANILDKLKKIENVNITRKELINDLEKASRFAYVNNVSVFESMKIIRNMKRRIGRKTFSRCIGTTLLTKGLEFDTVVILDAHKFKNKENLYVAMTRASRRLVVFSENNIIKFKQL